MTSTQEIISAIVGFDLTIIPGFVAGKVLDVATRSTIAMKLRHQLGIPIKPRSFDEAYRAALIDYGIGKPSELLQLFQHQDVKEAFQEWYEDRGELQTIDITSAVIENDPIGQRLRDRELDSNAKSEVYQFAFYLTEQVKLMKSSYDQLQDAKIKDIHKRLQFLVSIDDFDDLRQRVQKRLDEQEEVINGLHSRMEDAIGTPVDIIGSVEYKGIVFRDRRQSELAAFFEHNNVTWQYHRYSKQISPSIVLFGPRFEISNVREVEDTDYYVVTVPFGVTEDKEIWFRQFTVMVEELSYRKPVMIVLGITSINLISSNSNLHPFIMDDEVLAISDNEESHPAYLVTDGYWDHVSWYICEGCGKFSIPDRVSDWDIIKEGAEPSPDEICPHCRDMFIQLCSRCESAFYDSRDANFCDYCQHMWNKIQDE